jgi:hypothetical protein
MIIGNLHGFIYSAGCRAVEVKAFSPGMKTDPTITNYCFLSMKIPGKDLIVCKDFLYWISESERLESSLPGGKAAIHERGRPSGFDNTQRRRSMKTTVFAVCLVALLSLAAASYAEPQAAARDAGKKIQGAWSIESMDVGTIENRRTIVPQAFMIFIMEKHYSAIRDLAQKPAPGAESSASSKMADAGTYEFDGKELVVHHKVAMFPALGSMTFKCSMEGDDILILEPQYDKMVMPGMNVKPSPDGKMGYGDMAVKYRFKRLE